MNEETRIFNVKNLDIREADGENPLQINGYASVYNALSEDLGGFREIVRPSFFEPVLDNDVRATINHDPNRVLGRSTSGTLRLVNDDHGLGVRINAPDTTYARDLITSIKRGDIDQMSFVFRVAEGGDRWSNAADGYLLRELITAGELRDVSVVTYPAYPQTSAEARAKCAQMSLQLTAGAADNNKPEGAAAGAAKARRRRLEIAKRRI